MKLLVYLCILVTLLSTKEVVAFTKDEYFHAYREVLKDVPTKKQELTVLIDRSPVLSDSSPVASIYIALLDSLFDHPTGFEVYLTVSPDVSAQIKATHPSLYYRHQILEAYNLGINGDWDAAHRIIDNIISNSVGIDEELYLDAVVTKSEFLGRMGLIRASLNEISRVLHRLPSLKNKDFFGNGAIQNAELLIGLSMSYLGEYEKAIELCSEAQNFFEERPMSSPHRYFQVSMDCQRRSFEGLNKSKQAHMILEEYVSYAEKINDWETFVYGLVLKIENYYQKEKIADAINLIERTQEFVLTLPESYDKATYDIARFKAAVFRGQYEVAEQLSLELSERLKDIPNGDLLLAEFNAIQSDLFETKGEMVNAINALRESKNYYQSLYFQTDERKELFSDYYESALAERKLQLLSKEHELSKLKLASSSKLNSLFVAGLVLLTLALIVISYLLIVQRKLKKEQEKLASTDPLTGISNRRSVLSAIGLEVEKAKKYEKTLSLALIDLDYFKTINDKYGHDFGDKLLQRFTRYFDSNIRKTDVFGRYGGEEFVVCFPMTSASDAKKILENILNGYTKLQIDAADIKNQTFSAGVTECINGEKTSSLISQCDKALYKAKHHGRGRIYIFNG